MAYDTAFRERAIAFKESGATFKEVNIVFGIDPKTLKSWIKLRDETGSVAYQKVYRERKRKIDKEELKRLVEEKPDAYLAEFAERFDCSVPAVFYALKKLKITLKKRPLPIRKNQMKNGRNT